VTVSGIVYMLVPLSTVHGEQILLIAIDGVQQEMLISQVRRSTRVLISP
jgi:predicted CDP-diglyceride synthetase/phosphatidate cytidylyltransferase